MSIFDSFERKHDYLVCVDSDGCVMDTMNCKHFHCFGPCMVTEWGLEQWKDAILERWNVINLFSMTRGINRFKGLAMALGEIDKQYKPITGIAALQHWADTAPALSNDAVAKAAAEATDPEARLVFEKALSWSKAVNAAIVKLDESLKVPYNGAKEGLAAAHQFADVAMVSSANRDAVEEELPGRLVLDLSGVSFMDSSGIAVVMRARNRMQQLGGRLKLRGTASQVRKVFDAAGISRLVEME